LNHHLPLHSLSQSNVQFSLTLTILPVWRCFLAWGKLFFLLLGASFWLSAQEEKPTLLVQHIEEPITIDGKELEVAWATAQEATIGWQHFPINSTNIEHPTTLKMLFDEQNLYLLCKAYSSSDQYITPSLRRDFSGAASDKINFTIDTYSDGNTAYMFGSNPFGVKSDLLISNGGVGDARSDINRDWDVKFDVEGETYEGYFIIEMRIPLASLNFPENSTSWRFNFFRFDTQLGVRTSWAYIPQVYKDFNLAFMGTLQFDRPLGKSNTPLSIIPYVNTRSEKQFPAELQTERITTGGDVKVPIGNGLNLDLTLNPDFSQVEVDDEIINLTQFEIVVPEKRQFFLQNSDLFSNFGAARMVTPFLTRRIGVARDKDGNTIENRIIAGARLSGKLNNNWRIGFLNMLTDEDLVNEIASQNNTVLSLQKNVFSRSRLKLLFINREATKSYSFLEEKDRFNRLAGLEYDLNTMDNLWKGRYFFYYSQSPQQGNDNLSSGFALERETRRNRIGFEVDYLGDDFRIDLGLLRRKGVIKTVPEYAHFFYPKKGRVNFYELRQNIWLWTKPDLNNKLLERTLRTTFEINFNNQTVLGLSYFDRNEFLNADFDPTGINPESPLQGEAYYYSNNVELSFQSDRKRKLTFLSTQSYGQFYGGLKYSVTNNVSLRLQPRLVTTLKLNYDHITQLPNQPTTKLWLVGPKFDFTFSKNLFWSTLIQFSSQSENLGFNSRLQWRFAPLSDLYIVYNNNYYTLPELQPRYRSINLKMTYWLNL